VLAHAPSASKDAVPLAIDEPKLSPLIVTLDSPALRTTFAPTLSYDTTGASKLSPDVIVPAMLPTVTALVPDIDATELLKHARMVADVHDDVLHVDISSAPVVL
jgi:hypothetical protein